MSKLMICLLLAFAAAVGPAKADALTDENKRVVTQFYELAFGKH